MPNEVRRDAVLHTGKSLAVSPPKLPSELIPKDRLFLSIQSVSARISQIALCGCYPLPFYSRSDKSTKFEYRNPKQIQIFKIQNQKPDVYVLDFKFLSFEFVSNFVLRISNFCRPAGVCSDFPHRHKADAIVRYGNLLPL